MPGLDSYALDQCGLDGGSGGGVTIKTLQRGSATIPLNQTSVNVSISSVDATKAILRFGIYTLATVASNACVNGSFPNNTTIAFTRTTADPTNTAVLYWEVIEFGNVKSVQKGSTTSTSTTISEVDTSNSLIFSSHNSTSPNNVTTSNANRFINSTTINLVGQPTGTNNINYQVIEFID